MAFLLDFAAMTPDERSLLERTAAMVQDNNNILRKMRRSSRVAMALHAFYWVVIIGLTFGAYYFIQPYASLLLSDDMAATLQDIVKTYDPRK